MRRGTTIKPDEHLSTPEIRTYLPPPTTLTPLTTEEQVVKDWYTSNRDADDVPYMSLSLADRDSINLYYNHVIVNGNTI